MQDNEKPAEGGEKQDKGGLFTGRLAWWQILLAVVLVGYLLYGKYQETAAGSQGAPSVPAKSK